MSVVGEARLEHLIPIALLNKGSRMREPDCITSVDMDVMGVYQAGQTFYICGELGGRSFTNSFIPYSPAWQVYESGWLRERADCAEVCDAIARAERRRRA